MNWLFLLLINSAVVSGEVVVQILSLYGRVAGDFRPDLFMLRDIYTVSYGLQLALIAIVGVQFLVWMSRYIEGDSDNSDGVGINDPSSPGFIGGADIYHLDASRHHHR